MKIIPDDYAKYKALSTLTGTPLWAIGNLDILNMPLVSVVGSRAVSERGVAIAMKCAKILVENNIGIVSGLALGVDAIAHRYALENGGRTVAVMGTSIEQCYPEENAALLSSIKDNGLVLSQFKPGSVTQKWNFPRRNITMAELSGITIVAEATQSSGTKHQVSHALNIGKRVGFPRSLVLQKVTWIRDALNNKNAFIISSPQDLEKQLAEVFEHGTGTGC